MWDKTKVRKLATAAAVSLVLASGGVRALGLGDIEMRSALNQPMNAEIRLTSVQPGEADGMIVKLASPDAFSRAGIERTSSLTDLRFSVDTASGTPVIRISSNKPVVEPFLNFLLEVDWPSGRMVREYTVLLDPPVFMTPSASATSPTEQPAILQRSDTSLIAPTPIERDTASTDGFEVEIVGSAVEISDNAVLPTDGGDVVSLDDLGSSSLGAVEIIDDTAVSFDTPIGGGEVVALSDLEVSNSEAAVQFQNDQIAAVADYSFDVEIVGSSNEVSDTFVGGGQVAGGSSDIVSLDSLDSEVAVGSGGGEVTVQRGDTLAEIARANAVQGVSPQQMMMALLSANQGSFINGNVNLVKAGSILRIPDGAELSQLTQAQAVAQMGEQNQLWREYRDNIRGTSGTRVAANTPSSESIDSTDAAKTELSEAAQRILDAAKDETLNRNELSIVAESDSTTTVASATADNSESSADAQLGEINKKLQLAKEELASTRLQTTDLDEQSADLQSTSENMESLVGIRQQEVARLQEQLKQASADSDAEGGLVDSAQGVVADAGNAVTDTAGDAVDATQNALSAAGEKLPEVELVAEVPEVEITPPALQTPWYTDILQKFGKWIVIGIGAISALLLGLLLLGKRRKKDDDMLDYGDDVEFLDDENDGVQLHAESGFDEPESSTGIGSAVATGVAGAAAVGGITAAAQTNASEEIEDTELGSHMDTVDEANAQDSLDPDDTISEVDVYLAYGLHGQAEELLAKAIEREPDNHEYALKLLQTQHAQGNGDAFSEGAESYHERFGGENSPEWSGVCEMGYDLQPNNILFASSATSVQNVGKGDFDSPTLDDSDFDPAAGAVASAGSVSRNFGDASDTPIDVNESDLMDQSLDPAFAFDETDLEATGDFSQIANEIASEEVSVGGDSLVDDNSLDFPGFDAGDAVGDKLGDVADAGKDKLGDAGSALKGGIGGVGAGLGAAAAGGAALVGGLGSKAADAKDSATGMFDDALSLDDLDVGDAANNAQGSVSEDLTLDLDQLSGDLELDGTDLLDDSTASLDGLEMPDLTSDNELLSDDLGQMEGSDEMDTMMDLAKAYIDMGDKDSASSALGEIVKSGNPAQKSEAETLLLKIS